MDYSVVSKCVEDTESIGRSFSKKLKGKEVVALFGGLGSGKTTFVRGVVEGLLGDSEEVSSPTFTIVNEYRKEQREKHIFHFDMYRIKSQEDLYLTGYYDYLNEGILIIEWSENMMKWLPEETIKIFFKKGEDDNTRKLVFEGIDYSEDIRHRQLL